MAEGGRVKVERADGVAEVTLDNPPLNLFDQAMIEAVIETIAELAAEPPRAVLFRAEGDVVSGGVNVEEFRGLTGDQGRELWTRLMDQVIEPVAKTAPPPGVSNRTISARFRASAFSPLMVAMCERSSSGTVTKEAGGSSDRASMAVPSGVPSVKSARSSSKPAAPPPDRP